MAKKKTQAEPPARGLTGPTAGSRRESAEMFTIRRKGDFVVTGLALPGTSDVVRMDRGEKQFKVDLRTARAAIGSGHFEAAPDSKAKLKE